MKPASRYSVLLLVVGSALVGAFLLGRHYEGEQVVVRQVDCSDRFLKGQALERGRSAWINAANLHSYLAFFGSSRLNELPDRIEDNLWYSIPDLYQFTTNSDASAREREGVKEVLKRVVLYFYKHPREHVQAENVNLSEEVAKAAKKSPLSSDAHSTEQKVFEELAEGVGRALSGLDGAIEETLVTLSEADREIQAILDQLVEQREFPGRERSWAGITILLPRLEGRSSGGSDDQSFRHRGKDFDLIVTKDKIALNGQDYGEVPQGSVIDCRVPEKVFVDGKLRTPIANQARQGAAESTSRSDSVSESVQADPIDQDSLETERLTKAHGPDAEELAKAIAVATHKLQTTVPSSSDYKLIKIELVRVEGDAIWQATYKLSRLIPQNSKGLIGAGGEVFVSVDLKTGRATVRYGE
jgi:hypothetical protein